MAKQTFADLKKELEKAKQEVEDIKKRVTKRDYYQGAVAGGIAIAVIYTVLLLIF